jgi:hypothetical protein
MAYMRDTELGVITKAAIERAGGDALMLKAAQTIYAYLAETIAQRAYDAGYAKAFEDIKQIAERGIR